MVRNVFQEGRVVFELLLLRLHLLSGTATERATPGCVVQAGLISHGHVTVVKARLFPLVILLQVLPQGPLVIHLCQTGKEKLMTYFLSQFWSFQITVLPGVKLWCVALRLVVWCLVLGFIAIQPRILSTGVRAAGVVVVPRRRVHGRHSAVRAVGCRLHSRGQNEASFDRRT